MKKVKIKNTELETLPINFGGNVFGWTLDEGRSFEMLDKFTEAGFNFVDTADTYAWWLNGVGGQSETIIGKWMKARAARQKMIIATKVGSQTKEHGYDISRKHILKSIDESLQRLQTDYVDIYYTHFDSEATPLEETLGTYAEIIQSGKVRYIAASNISSERLTQSFEVCEANNWPKYVALQPHYNLVERTKFETEYAPLIQKYDLSVFPYWSLAAGFLTGKYRTESDFSKFARGEGIRKYFNEEGKSVLNSLDIISQKYSTTQATVALAWLLANPLITAPIVSATNEIQLRSLFEATNIKLDSHDLELLNK